MQHHKGNILLDNQYILLLKHRFHKVLHIGGKNHRWQKYLLDILDDIDLYKGKNLRYNLCKKWRIHSWYNFLSRYGIRSLKQKFQLGILLRTHYRLRGILFRILCILLLSYIEGNCWNMGNRYHLLNSV